MYKIRERHDNTVSLQLQFLAIFEFTYFCEKVLLRSLITNVIRTKVAKLLTFNFPHSLPLIEEVKLFAVYSTTLVFIT